MSFKAVLWAWRQEVSHRHKLVLAVIGSHKNPTSGKCFPSISTLAAETSMSERSIRRYIQELKSMGVLTTKSRWDYDGARLSNGYELVGESNDDPLVSVGKGGVVNVGRLYNHNHNHKCITPSDRSKHAKKNAEDQDALNRIAHMLGDNGWEILMFFEREAALLVGKYRRGVLRDEELSELIRRYLHAQVGIVEGGGGQNSQ